MKKESTKSKKLVITLITIIIGVIIIISAYGYHVLNKVKITPISKINEDLGINSNVQYPKNKEAYYMENTTKSSITISNIDEIYNNDKNIEENIYEKDELHKKTSDVKEKNETENDKYKIDKNVTNIAFFGLDRRNKNDSCRSDTIIIVSLDTKLKKIKISSIMRDTYVNIKDHDMTKINHAYAYDGPQLAVRTLNENFNLDIRNFVAVDFFQLEDIIDALGGINIDMQSEEIEHTNYNMAHVARLEKKSVIPVTEAGTQILNGMQAVAYSRIRSTAGGDFRRSERQRTVLTAMMQKIKNAGKGEFVQIVTQILPFVETSLNKTDILKTGMSVFSLDINTIEEKRFPLDGYCSGEMIEGVWYLVTDLEMTSGQLHKYIYDEEKS